MDKNAHFSIFDFIALLLSDLGETAYRDYAGLQVKSLYLNDNQQAFIRDFIDKIKKSYTKRNKNYRTDIVKDGIPDDVSTAYTTNTTFRSNKDAVYKLAYEIPKCFLNYDNVLDASQTAYDLAQANNSVGFSQLNSDKSVATTNYILLPDLGTFGDIDNVDQTSKTDKPYRVNKSTTPYEKILLNRLIILTVSDLKTKDGRQYQVQNVMPSRGTHTIRKLPNEPLVLAVSPICNRWLLRDNPSITTNKYCNDEYRFQIDGLSDEEYVIKRVFASYKEASKYGVDIMLFPEMYGTKVLTLQPYVIFKDITDGKIPIAVMPSYWHDRTNEAPVLDDAALPLFCQRKYSSFLYEKDGLRYLEDLSNNDRQVIMYHSPKIGRLCVCICKDFLMDSYRRMLSESLEASILLVPAFTPDTAPFTKCLDELKHAGTYGLFVNCCAAHPVKKKNSDEALITNKCVAGQVTVTKAPSDNSTPSYKLLHPKCNGNCGGPESHCIFIITITDDGSITVDHKH